MGLLNSFVFSALFLLGVVKSTFGTNHVYDFEDASVPGEITTPGSTSLELDTNQHKHGAKSLKWNWTTASEMTWDLTSKNIAGNEARRGGIKLWIKNENPFHGKCLSFCFSKIKQATGKTGCSSLTNNPPTVSCFPFSLNFKGWRAAWVTYSEFNGCPSPFSSASSPSPVDGTDCYVWKITKLTVTVSAGVTSPSFFYFDFFRFFDSLSTYRATRDATVPPLKLAGNTACTTCNKIHDANNGLTEADALARHSRNSHAHQIYRWSLKTSSVSMAATVDTAKLASLHLIAKRVDNWYANKDTTFTKIGKTATGVEFYLRKKWRSLLQFSRRAGNNRGQLNGRGLFSAYENGVSSDKKFTWVFQYVLFPLTLDYYIQSRPNEVNNLACKKAKKETCPTPSSPAVSSSSPPCSAKVTTTNLNNCKASITKQLDGNKQNILQLFDYINDQGWQSGSALGSIDYEGLGLSGFMHSAFMMRSELETANKLDNIIDTMKWYTYFGEIYQQTFEHKGTSADEVRTSMLFRLLTVLAMPETNDNKKKEKIRDMDALKLWIENALTINEGLDGFVKPDFTTSHHKTFYGSAYCASALNAASLLYYLLQGTQFQLKDEIKTNLVKALKVFRTTAVHYSTPSQIGGRFPKYDLAILAHHVQAYAYLAANPPNAASSNILTGTTLNTYSGVVGMFLRLYEHTAGTCDGKINRNLCSGNIQRIFYLNTLGSVEIMEKVKTLASGTSAESSPSGHWYKPFAALSIHRRNNWAVTVKGFDKYVWDYEQGSNENLYGMYTSHGSILIANSESALSSKNVDEGWDWRKIPGTTAINLEFSEMLHNEHRLYNNRRNTDSFWDTMAGGLSLMGSKPNSADKNGVFGMNFLQPLYVPIGSIDFRFKKSVFFYDDIIVSLGSDIKCIGTTGINKGVQTALFQDKMKSTLPSSTPVVQHVYRCNDAGSANYEKSNWDTNTALVILVDVHGNRYYIPNPKQQGLVFTRNKAQTSVKSTNRNQQTTGTYCTAWLNHGQNPTGTKAKYEYLVQVDAEPSGGSRKPVLTPSAIYEVIQQDKNAHMVKFPSQNNRGIVHGYVVFPVGSKVTFGSGPLKSTSKQSIIMVEEKVDNLFTSVSHPDLSLRKVSGSPSWCDDGDTTPIRYDDAGKVLRYCAKSTAHTIAVEFRKKWRKLISLHVKGEDKLASKDEYLTINKKISTFKKLRNGDVTEVKYKKR